MAYRRSGGSVLMVVIADVIWLGEESTGKACDLFSLFVDSEGAAILER